MLKKLFSLFLISLTLTFVSGCEREKEQVEKNEYCKVFVGDSDISDYEIVYDGKRTYPIAKEMQKYVEKTSGYKLPVINAKKNSEAPDILIRIYEDRKYEGADFHVENANIEIEGNAYIFVQPKMYEFVNTYLGWRDAGKENEYRDIVAETIRIPENVLETNENEAWIKEREAIVVLWKPNFSRGTVYNAATSNLTDVLSFTDEQIYEYVRMLKFCGFTGVQMTDMCSAWAGESSYEFTHQQIRKFADAAHSLNMKFTLWVWAAEFGNFSYSDDSVTYSKGKYEHAYENPEVVATFEKYYDIYAELADCCDRVIAHYSDPGELETSTDCAYFAKLLKDKFVAINPDIDFGVDCWGNGVYIHDLAEVFDGDITIYENSHSDTEEGASLRKDVAKNSFRLGTWSWATIEMETDQLAQMNYNIEFTKRTYNNMQTFDYLMPTAYWSEMEAYHLLNVFALYGSGHLLQNPLRNTDELTNEIAMAAVGPENAEKFARVLRLIEKARIGEDEESFAWNSDEYRLKSKDYPKEEILSECKELIPFIEKLIADETESYSLPLPISMTELLKLMLPHLKQIEQFAEFRCSFDAAVENFGEKIEESDISADDTNVLIEDMQKLLNEIGEPIPEYNCTIGLWGQIEDRAMREMICETVRKYEQYGLEIPIYPEYDALRKYRIYSAFQSAQLGKRYPVEQSTYQWGVAYQYETDRLIDEMVQEGILERQTNGSVILSNWESFIYNFN